MIEIIKKIDETVFLFLNNMGCESWDWFWIFITGNYSSVPLYLFIAYLFKKGQTWKSLIINLLLIALIILIVDQSINVIKYGIERLRPCHFFDPEIFRAVVRCGGKYGFISAHAGNSFAFAVFVYLTLRRKYPLISILFVWAAITAYSRVYVGVHYPLDIICGGLYGGLIGYGIYKLKQKIKI